MKSFLLLILFYGLTDIWYSAAHKQAGTTIYKYESQILTGIPHLDLQYAGFKIKCNVIIQSQRGLSIILKLDDIQILTINNKVPFIPSHDIVSDDYYIEADKEVLTLYSTWLSKPIKFRYDKGRVSKLQAQHNDPDWSVNIKKAILSLLNLDLTHKTSVEPIDDGVQDVLMSNEYYNDEMLAKVYKTIEADIDGECESVYLVKEPSTDEEGDFDFEVDKIRNYANCQSEPSYEEGMLSSYIIDANNFDSKPAVVRAYGQSSYKIKGGINNPTIYEAKRHSKYVVTPRSKEEGEIISFNVQELHRVESHEAMLPIPIPFDMKPIREGMELRFEQKLDNDRVDPYSEIDIQIIQAIESLLTKSAEEMSQKINENVIYNMVKLRSLMRYAPKKEIVKLLEKLWGESNIGIRGMAYKKYKIYADLLPYCGNPYVIKILPKILQEKIWSPMEVATAINVISVNARPTPLLVEALLPSSELYQLNEAQSSLQIRQAILLSLGTVYRGFRKAVKREAIKSEEANNINKKFETELTNMLNHQKSLEERVNAIKCIGNSGSSYLFEHIARLIEDKKETLNVRLNSVHALRRMSADMSDKIQRVLLNVYMDPSEIPPLRIGAYAIFINSQPGAAYIKSIVYSLRAEKVFQIGAFVYSHLLDVANSERQSYTKIRREVQNVLQDLKPFIPDRFYSYSYSLDRLSSELGLGAYADIFLLDTPQSMCPVTMDSRFGGTLFGKEFSFFEYGFNVRGLEEMIRKLFGTDWRNEIVQDILDIVTDLVGKDPNMERIITAIKSVTKKLGLDQPSPDSFKYIGFIRLFENEIRHMKLTAEDVLEYLDKNSDKLIETINKLIQNLINRFEADNISNLASHSALLIPTTTGVPLFINSTYINSIRIHGSAHLSDYPSALWTKKDPVSLETDFKVSMAFWLQGSMGYTLPLLQSGVDISGKWISEAPLRFKIEADPDVASVSIKRKEVPEEYDISEIVVRPATFVGHRITDAFEREDDYDVKEIQNPKFVKPIKFKIPIENNYVKVQSEWEISVPVVDFAPANPLRGKYTMKLRLIPKIKDESDMEIKIELPQLKRYIEEGLETSDNIAREEKSLFQRSKNIWDESNPDPFFKVPEEHYVLVNIKAYDQIDAIVKFILYTDKDMNKIQVIAKADDIKAEMKGLLDFYVNVDRKEVVENEYVAKLVIGSNNESVYVAKAYRTDRDEKMEIPVEPFSIYYIRKAAGIVIESKDSEGYANPFSWIYGESDEFQEKRLTAPLEEITGKVYKCSIDINYENLPDFLEKISEYITNYIRHKGMSKRAVVESDMDNMDHKGQVSYIIRMMPDMEKLHLLVKTPGKDVVYYLPARYPLWLKRSLSLDNSLLYPEHDPDLMMTADSEGWRKKNCSTVRRTLVRRQVCMSITPVSMCKGSCKEAGKDESRENVPFYCMPTSSRRARRLLEESMKRPLNEMSNRKPHFYMRIPAADKCEI